jgi:cell division protein FtsB
LIFVVEIYYKGERNSNFPPGGCADDAYARAGAASGGLVSPEPAPVMSSQLLKAASFILLAYSLITLPVVIFGDSQRPKIEQLEHQLEDIRTDSERIRWEIKEMKEQISRLRSDPHLIKRVARQEFGYVGKDELIFIVD